MAYLKTLKTTCTKTGCFKIAVVELFSAENYSIGVYCRKHGNELLKQYTDSEMNRITKNLYKAKQGSD